MRQLVNGKGLRKEHYVKLIKLKVGKHIILKISLIIILFLSMPSFSQTNFDDFNKPKDDSIKIVFQSYTEIQQTHYLAFLSNGYIIYQSSDYDYIDDRKINMTFKSIEEIKKMTDDMEKVRKSKKEVVTDNYAIQNGEMGSVKLKIKHIPKTYYFTKYALRLFKKELSKY